MSFQLLFPAASPEAIDLLNNMLALDPLKRFTVEDALGHAFFQDLHSEGTLPLHSLPVLNNLSCAYLLFKPLCS